VSRNGRHKTAEKLIEENVSQRELRRLSDSVGAYYDSLSAREQQRDREWGEFGTSEFLRFSAEEA
jgi:hypothetical protein